MSINDCKKHKPFFEKWYLSKELGRGSYGAVFEAEARDIGTMKSAIKIVSIPSSPSEIASYKEEHFGVDEESVSSYFYGFVEEFLKEIRIMAQLKGKSNIVSIEDYVVKKHAESIGWDIIIRMELLASLNKYFAGKAISESDVIKLGIDICKALEECEKQNIIHRDIKPSNIFVTDAGEYKLGDFGVARTLEKASSGLSKKGTYTYMAPEVYKGEENYGLSIDTYSLGIVMYKLLNNNFEPFRSQLTFIDEENALKSRMNNEPMPKPANASEEVAQIILKACSYADKDRYTSARFMREELEKACGVKTSFPEPEPASLPITPESDEPTHGIFDGDGQSNYKVTLIKRTKGAGEIDVYVDGNLYASNISDETYDVFPKTGSHTIGICAGQSQFNGTLLKTAKTLSEPLGAKFTVEIVVDAATSIIYGKDTLRGGLKIFQISGSGEVEQGEGRELSPKSKMITLILACIPYTGWFGIHDFYLGKVGMGILKVFTINFFLFGWIVDIIRILAGKYKDKNSMMLR